jgi:hypothetical protein
LPLTFPSHAAAILPLYRAAPGLLHPTALVVGSAVPDFAYLLDVDGAVSHHLSGLLTFCLPLGLFTFFWAECLALPALKESLPTLRGVELARFAQTRGLPKSAIGWLGVIAALLLGALTHLLWDGFTHTTLWPARSLYADVAFEIGGRELSLTRALQHSSSALGLVIFAVYLWRIYPSLPSAAPGALRALLLIAAPAALFCGAAFLWRWGDVTARASFGYRLWLSFWLGVAGALFGFTLGCLLVRLVWRHLR